MPTVAQDSEEFQRALSALQAGNLKDAERLFKGVLRSNPTHVAALNLLGAVLTQLNRFAEAEEYLRRALGQQRDSEVTLYNHGIVLKALNRPSEALESFNQALKINAAVAETWNNRGTIFNDLKRYDAAIEDFDRAIRINPQYADAFCNKGKALAILKRFEHALSAFATALALKPDLAEGWLGRGNVYVELKQHDAALAAYDRALALKPNLAEIWLARGNILTELNYHEDALASYDRALTSKPDLVEAWFNRGNTLWKLRRYDDALLAYNRTLALNPDDVGALVGRGNVFTESKRYEDALAAYDKAVSLAPELPQASLGRGRVFHELKQHQAALAAFDRALELKPDLAEAWANRGNVLSELKRYHDALRAYDEALVLNPTLADASVSRGNVFFKLRQRSDALAAYDYALNLRPDLVEAWVGRSSVLNELKRYDDALAAGDRALNLNCDLAEAWLCRGNVFYELKQQSDALAAYDKALNLSPDLAEAWLGRGNVFYELKQQRDALAAYDKALNLSPDLAEAWLGRGNVFFEGRQYDKAVVDYDRALTFDPDLEDAVGYRLHAKLQSCDWSNFESEIAELLAGIRKGNASASPFTLLGLSSSAADQLQGASAFVAARPSFQPIWRGGLRSHDRIRLAYLSADLRDHPVAYLTAGLFESHDRSRFEVTALSLSRGGDSEFCHRIQTAFEHFLDVGQLSDLDIANLIRHHEIDIVVDLTGITHQARLGILARRPAPIQVNYLGFPGTFGATYMDYIIADRYLIPEAQQQHYSEKIIYLPDVFQANDSKRKISDRVFSRTEAGLPEGAFVFCAFNNSFKITPPFFDLWMRLLRSVDNSVLWLVANDANVQHHLRKEAVNRGVDAERLVFAPRIAYSEYLARYRLVDLFLDTFPFNAGATASDALWAGLPMITCSGESLASRMAGSLLHAIGMPEMIADSLTNYEELARKLADRPDLIAAARAKLACNRMRYPLFDTNRFTRHFEAALTFVHERRKANLSPDHVRLTA